MSATLEATRPAGQKKKFGKTERHVPHHTEKAKKWYSPEDEVTHKKVGNSISCDEVIVGWGLSVLRLALA